MCDLRLLAIAGPPLVPAADLVPRCADAVAGGVTAVQLRHKSASARELLRLAERLVRALSVPVFVNDRADVGWLAGAAGVHLGQDDIPPQAVRRFALRPFRIGISVGTAAEAEAALQGDVDYWSIGAIYPTDTKTDAGVPIGVEGFRALAARAPRGMPVIAIGGINATNAGEIVAAGAAGIAVSRAIFASPNSAAAAAALRESV